MRAILSAPGSRGDVNPMIAIGAELRSLGYEVVISIAEPYAEVAQSAGLTVETVIDQQSFDAILSGPNVWKPVRGAITIIRGMFADFLPRHDAVIRKHHVPGETVLVSHPLDLASRVFRDTDLTTPLIDIHLAPMILRTFDDPPRLSPWWFEVMRPPSLVRAAYWLVDRVAIDPFLVGPLNRMRAEHSLPPVRSPLNEWWLSPDRILAMYPDWFAPATRSFEPRLVHCGFPLQDIDGENYQPPPDRPIVFTAGTAHHHCREFFHRCVEACVTLDHPGLLVSSFAENFPADLPPNVRTAPYVSFSELLPHCAAMVHHGGIGTTSQCLAAGIPQVIRPNAFDQFDNATRVQRLGCGRWLKRRGLRTKDSQLTETLRSILDNRQMSKQCATISKQLDTQATRRAAHEIDMLARRRA